MTFTLVRMGLPNSVVLLALALLPGIALAIAPSEARRAPQPEGLAVVATGTGAAQDGSVIFAD
jgi:hypothetical protein